MTDTAGMDPGSIIRDRMELLSLTAELSTIYAKDTSEKANIAAIDAISRAFRASAAALFYMNGNKEFRICIAGTDFPIALPERRWRACVEKHTQDANGARFGPWSIPGLEISLPSWISVRLYTTSDEGAYMFLGRRQGNWSDRELSSFSYIVESIAPIVSVRHERGIEERKRMDAERKLARNESRLRDLIDGSRDMIYSVDPQDIITSVNRMGGTLLGVKSKEELIGRRFESILLNPADRDPFMQRVLADGFVDDYEVDLKRSDGETLHCIETAHALKEPDGRIREIQGIVKDISERYRSERKLWAANQELAEANLKLQRTKTLMIQHEKMASIGLLAAGVAHEINNPLGFLMSNHATLERYFSKLRTALESPQPSAVNLAGQFKDAEAIFAESKDGFERIQKIVGGLKRFAHTEGDRRFELYDVNAGIESTLAMARNELKYVADIRKTLAPLPPVTAVGGEINQVFLNILVNAAQAMASCTRNEKGHIDISTRIEGGSVLIVIRDDGPGIPREILDKIMDPFFTTKEPGKGTGLGLSISYDIITVKHGGSFWVESEPGRGAAFFILLPVEHTNTEDHKSIDRHRNIDEHRNTEVIHGTCT
jgi:PAS domain S-box-containing protein